MDTFNDAALTPDQLKLLTLQFMGQHVTGDLKELDKNLVAKNQTLQGMILNPVEVLNTISTPVTPPPAPPQPSIEVYQPAPVETSVQTVTVPAAIVDQQPKVDEVPANTNQLEFNFETSPLSVQIFEALERIEKKLTSIDDRLFALENAKKKDQ
jgi:hypothetical protein